MKTTLSSKGQVVLPGPVRKRLGLKAGESLLVAVDAEDRIVLSRSSEPPAEAETEIDPLSGLPVLVPGGQRILTSDQVSEILSDFP